MESNQLRVEEVASDNIVERELQPPKPLKRKKKKMSFAVWLELHAPEELKISANNIQQQDASLVTENESITKALETVDQKGDRPTPESDSNEKNQVPFKTWSEEHVPVDPEISAGKTEEQNESLISVEESIAGVQETIDTPEKEEPSKSKEQPPKTRRNKRKMIPFHIWLEKQAPVDQKSSSGSTGTEDVSPVTTQESIAVLQETPEKEESSKSGTENVKKQDTLLLEEEGYQEDSLKKKSCSEEPAISATQLVTGKKSISKSQKKENQKGEKTTSTTKRIKKTPLLWKSFPESDARIDLAFFTKNSDINDGPLSENQRYQEPLSSSGKKTFWKMLPKSEPRIDISFVAENIETQNVSMLAQQRDEAASLKKESYTENSVISITPLVTKQESICKPQETLDQKGEKCPATGMPKDNIQTEFPDSQTAENAPGESLTEIQDLPNSSGKTTSQAKCACLAKSKESDLGHNEVQKYLMKQLDDMFDINQKLNAKLKQQKELMRKRPSERRQTQNSMVSVQIQTDSQESSQQKTVHSQSASVQTEMDVQETSRQLKPVRRTISTQTETEVLETSRQLKPVRRTISTQTEMEVLETRCDLEPAYQSISTQTELLLLLRKQPSETQQSGHQDRQTELFKRSAGENRRESEMKAASELETLSNGKVSSANSEQDISVSEPVGDQTATIKNENHTKETVIGKLQQAIEDKTVSTIQQDGDHHDEKKPSRKSKRKIRRKAVMRAASELETPNSENLSGENIKQEDVSIPEIVRDSTATVNTENHRNEMIDKLQQVIEDDMFPEKQQHRDHQDEKRTSKKSKRKNKRKESTRAASELETLHNENVSGKHTELEVSVPEIGGDQTAKNEFHRNETVIAKVQQLTEEETVSTTKQNGDQQDEKKTSKKSKRKIRRKAAMKAASQPETPNSENLSAENIKQQVSIPEIVGDPTATINTEIAGNETVIEKLQQATEDDVFPEIQQYEDQQDEKRPLTKSKRKKKRKTAIKVELETIVNPVETDQTLIQHTMTKPKTDLEIIPEFPRMGLEQIETCKDSEDIPGKVPIVSREGQSGLMEKQRTSPPQIDVTLNEDVTQTASPESESQAAEESAELKIVSEQEERPKKKMSLWRHVKKAFTPSPLRQFKGRCKVHPA